MVCALEDGEEASEALKAIASEMLAAPDARLMIVVYQTRTAEKLAALATNRGELALAAMLLSCADFHHERVGDRRSKDDEILCAEVRDSLLHLNPFERERQVTRGIGLPLPEALDRGLQGLLKAARLAEQ